MFFKPQRRYLLLFMFAVLGLSLSLFPFSRRIPAVGAIAPASTQVTVSKSATEFETQGKYFYSISQFERAADAWQQAIKMYGTQDLLSRARVMSNLALAQSQSNNYPQPTRILLLASNYFAMATI